MQRREETERGERLGDRETQRTTTLRGQQEQKGEGNKQGQVGSSMSRVGCSPSRKKRKGRVPLSLLQQEEKATKQGSGRRIQADQ